MYTGVSSAMTQALSLRGHLWHGRDFSAKSVRIRHAPQPGNGTSHKRWAPLPYGGPSVTIDEGMPDSEVFDQLLLEDPAYLECPPALMLALAQRSEESGRRPKSLREARTYGEALDPGIREFCAGVWGVPIIDNYGAREVGTIAHQCPQSEILHVQSENVLVEVLDGQDRPCGPGQSGRILVTSILNYGTPLIRYALGDIVEVGGSCACGRGLPVLKRVRGRTKDLIHLPNGERLQASFWGILWEIPKIRQFQVIQTSLESLHLKLVAPAHLDESERQSLIGMMNERLVHEFQINITYHDQIAREPGGKFMTFKSELGSLEDSMAG
jgi:phenylacetate-CoA ligase